MCWCWVRVLLGEVICSYFGIIATTQEINRWELSKGPDVKYPSDRSLYVDGLNFSDHEFVMIGNVACCGTYANECIGKDKKHFAPNAEIVAHPALRARVEKPGESIFSVPSGYIVLLATRDFEPEELKSGNCEIFVL